MISNTSGRFCIPLGETTGAKVVGLAVGAAVGVEVGAAVEGLLVEGAKVGTWVGELGVPVIQLYC
jgi:hypothetical protein